MDDLGGNLAAMPRHRIPRLALALALALVPAVTAHAQATATPGATTVVVVRHAEKAKDDPRDPSLTPAGEERAKALAAALEGAGVAAVYVTEYKRTRLTAEPVARHFGLAVETRPREAQAAAAYAKALVPEILAKHAGKTVLVVGHNDTVPEIVRALAGRAVAPIGDAVYDRLFLVVLPPTGDARLFEARYGPAAP